MEPIALYPERVGLRLPPEVKRAAIQAARARGLSLSDWLRLVIARAAQEAPEPRRTAPRRRPGT